MATGGAAGHDASDVGWLFVSEYYNFVNKQPGKLYQFYNNKSSLIHGHEAETVKLCQGLPEIQARIAELDFQDCKVLVSNVDSQTSMNGGIIVQVLGEMSNKGGPYHKFAQTFFLAQQPNGYFVLNDVFRFLKEEVVDNEYADEVAVEENPVIQEQYVNDYTQKAVHRPEPEVHANHTAAAVAAPVEAIAPAAEVTSEAPVAPAAAAPTSRGSPAKAHHEEKAEKHAPAPAAEEKPAANHANHAPAAPAKQEAPAAAAPAPKADTKPKTWAALAANATPAAPKPAPAQSPKKPESRPAAPAKEAAAPKEAPAAQQQAPRKERANKDDDEALKYSIFVRNVKEGTTADALKQIFASLGGIRNIEVKKAFALIEFTTTEAAKKAIEQNKFQTASGEPLYVEEKKKPGSGGGGPRPAPAGGNAGANAGGNRGGRGNAGGRGGAGGSGSNNNNGGEKKGNNNNNNKQQAAAPAAAAAADK